MGIVYLVQPCECVDMYSKQGKQRYKIGMTKSETSLARILSYRKGTRYLVILKCEKEKELEKIIKDKFKEKFALIAGHEYFEGDEENMSRMFRKIYDEWELNIKKPIQEERTMIKRKEDEEEEEKEEEDKDKEKMMDVRTENCLACNGSRHAYWTDGIWGPCIDCCCIDCGKFAISCSCIGWSYETLLNDVVILKQKFYKLSNAKNYEALFTRKKCMLNLCSKYKEILYNISYGNGTSDGIEFDGIGPDNCKFLFDIDKNISKDDLTFERIYKNEKMNIGILLEMTFPNFIEQIEKIESKLEKFDVDFLIECINSY